VRRGGEIRHNDPRSEDAEAVEREHVLSSPRIAGTISETRGHSAGAFGRRLSSKGTLFIERSETSARTTQQRRIFFASQGKESLSHTYKGV
jgi:hypothetical protein